MAQCERHETGDKRQKHEVFGLGVCAEPRDADGEGESKGGQHSLAPREDQSSLNVDQECRQRHQDSGDQTWRPDMLPENEETERIPAEYQRRLIVESVAIREIATENELPDRSEESLDLG